MSSFEKYYMQPNFVVPEFVLPNIFDCQLCCSLICCFFSLVLYFLTTRRWQKYGLLRLPSAACSLKALLSCLSFCFKILRAAFVMAFYSLLENDKIWRFMVLYFKLLFADSNKIQFVLMKVMILQFSVITFFKVE